MGYVKHSDRTFEFTTLSMAGSDDVIVECVEMSNPDGFIGSITVSPDPSASRIRFDDQRELPLVVLQHWLSLLPSPFDA